MNNHIDARSSIGSSSLVSDPALIGPLGLALCCLSIGMNIVFPQMRSVPAAGFGLGIGGALQVLAGLTLWTRGRETASIALCAAGLFFLSLLSVLVFPEFGLGTAPDGLTLGSYLVMWALFFGIMTPGLRRECPSFALPLATALTCGALIVFTLGLSLGQAPLERLGGVLLIGAGLVTSLSVIGGILRGGTSARV